MNKLKHTPICLAVSAVVAARCRSTVLAQDSEERILEEVVTIGTRTTKPRSVTDSPVPVDVFNS